MSAEHFEVPARIDVRLGEIRSDMRGGQEGRSPISSAMRSATDWSRFTIRAVNRELSRLGSSRRPVCSIRSSPTRGAAM